MNIQLKAKRQDGFTIIELVVVILLLGILAATALPRFLDVTDEAHEAAVDGVVGGLSTGSSLFRATWVATGQPSTAVSDYGDGSLFANTQGYPIGASADIEVDAETQVSGAVADDTCYEIFEHVLQAGHPVVDSGVVDEGDFGTPSNIETQIEAEAADHTDADFIAILEQADPIGNSTTCHYYYVGQFRSGESGAGNTRIIPELQYNFTTGELVRTSFTLQVDNP